MTGPEKKRLERYLARFVKAERKSQVATVAGDVDTMNVLAVWSACRKDWIPEGRAPKDDFELWRWLWSCVWFDREELAALSNLGELQAERVLRRCYGLRIAYPDGGISKHATQLLEAHGRANEPEKSNRGRPKGSKDSKPRKKRSSDEE